MYRFDGKTGSSLGRLASSPGAMFMVNFNLCLADLTGSTDSNDPAYGVPNCVVDADDFFFYLDLFAASDSRADLTGSANPFDEEWGIPDGVIDADDFFYYLDLFAAGC